MGAVLAVPPRYRVCIPCSVACWLIFTERRMAMFEDPKPPDPVPEPEPTPEPTPAPPATA